MAVEAVLSCCGKLQLVRLGCSVQDYTEEIELWNSAPNVGRVTYFCSLIFDPSLVRCTYYYLYKHNFHPRLVPSSMLEVGSGTCTSLVESCHHSIDGLVLLLSLFFPKNSLIRYRCSTHSD